MPEEPLRDSNNQIIETQDTTAAPQPASTPPQHPVVTPVIIGPKSSHYKLWTILLVLVLMIISGYVGWLIGKGTDLSPFKDATKQLPEQVKNIKH